MSILKVRTLISKQWYPAATYSRTSKCSAICISMLYMYAKSVMTWSTHVCWNHGLRTPNEGINRRNLKFWADVADDICFGRTYKFGIGIWFSAMQWRRFPHRVSVVRGWNNWNVFMPLASSTILLQTSLLLCHSI